VDNQQSLRHMVSVSPDLRSPSQLRGLRATYTVHLRLIGKLTVAFLFVLIKLFSLGVTSEYRLKISVFKGDGSVSIKFSRSAILDGKRPFCFFEIHWKTCSRLNIIVN